MMKVVTGLSIGDRRYPATGDRGDVHNIAEGLYLGGDVQLIVNPGYNRARGPVVVLGIRVHVEF